MIGSRQRWEPLGAAPRRVASSLAPLAGSTDVMDGNWPAAARWWFAALDGRSLGEGSDSWTVQVVGMHVDGSDLWIQLQSAVDPTQGFVLHVIRGTSWYDAVSTLYPPRDR